jgi:hypothetical protein
VRNKLKILVIIFLTSLFSCGRKDMSYLYYNTEIFCPGKERILIKFARSYEVKVAILRADFVKRREGSDGNYTAIRLPGRKSFRIEDISPEELIECSLYESRRGQVERSYIRFF